HCPAPVRSRRFTNHDRKNAGVAPLTPRFLPRTDGFAAFCWLPPIFRSWSANIASFNLSICLSLNQLSR
ncbi:hypothetical protein HAX54_002909, partial [Datura stramonium]|nr:hypothetical protein [Datura stramonium]